MSLTGFSRRGLITGGLVTGGVALGGLLLSGCDRLSRAPAFQDFIGGAEGLTRKAQRLALAGQPLAKEFTLKDLSPVFKANGTMRPRTPEYLAAEADGFASWRLMIGGLVARPVALSLDQLRALPARTQITRHDCVEGWSAIGQWTGVQLGGLLRAAGLLPTAKYVVFHCADDLAHSADGADRYYESIDLFDAFHPQTLLAYAMNGAPLATAHGAPLRLRVERQLGYKQAKYIMRIEAVDRLEHIAGGKGGFWEDRGYAWYAGI
jgi:DMSO/TMAO reductase YedYZ molybdopterin-dependent catalytic subunit